MNAETRHPGAFTRPAAVPDELKSRPHWLVWKFIQKKDGKGRPVLGPNGQPKPSKVPFYLDGTARAGEQGTKDDVRKLCTYDEAIAACAKGKYHGVGLAFVGSGLVGLDFDGCVVDGVLDPRIERIVANTYCEFSPSGTGVHAFFEGTLPSKKDNANKVDRNPDGTRKDGKFDVEFFGDSGYLTFTGMMTPDVDLFGLENTVAPLTPAALGLFTERFPRHGGGSAITAIINAEDDDDDALLALDSERLGWDLDKAREVMRAISPNCSREKWVHCLMALHFEMHGSEEALDLADEWSSGLLTGDEIDNYGGRRDVEGRWKSFSSDGGGSLTGKFLLKQRNEENVQLKYAAADEWKHKLQTVESEFLLREQVIKELKADDRLDELAREALAQSLKQAFERLGTKFGIAVCRKLIAPERTFTEALDITDIPEWLDRWVYVTDKDQFYRCDSEQWLSMQGFNALHNRELPRNESGEITKAASYVALEDYKITVVTRAEYMPWCGPTFNLDGVECVNSFRPSSVPAEVDGISKRGKAAINRVVRHLSLVCGGRSELVRILVDWMAHNVQKPGIKIRWAPLIKGVPGDGKTVLGTVMEAVLGKPNVRNISPTVLKTDFTGWALGACVGVLEELRLVGHNRYDVLNAIKPYVTNNTIEIHPKGKDPYNTINTQNYLAFTNYVDALPLEDTDRRWFVIFTPWQRIEELQAAVTAGGGGDLGLYFDSLNELLAAHRAEIRHWLLNHDISSEFKANGHAPMTPDKQIMIGLSATDEEQAVREVIEEGGEDIGRDIFISSALSSEVGARGINVNVGTTAWSKLLVRMGYTRVAAKLKWKGKTEIVWVRGNANVTPDVLRERLLGTHKPSRAIGDQGDDERDFGDVNDVDEDDLFN